MLKNMLLASAAAFVVLGAAASLTNMKAVITSGNGADAALTHETFDLATQLRDLRDEQVRQATLLSVQETTIRRLQGDLARADKIALADPSGALRDDQATVADGSLGLAMPSPVRAERAAEYHAAWLQAVTLESELDAAQTAYRDLERTTAGRIAALEQETSARFAALERDHGFAISRLEAEIEQRDSSIVGLMHRIVSMQGGDAAAAPVAQVAARPAAPKAAAPAVPAMRAPAKAPVDEKPAEPRPAAPGNAAAAKGDAQSASMTGSLDDGVAAYRAGDYRKAFEIWRVLANDGDTRARFHLGALYYEGRGVERQLETAQVLLSMAAADGHEGAAALRDKVSAELSRAQVARAPESVSR